MDRKFKVGDRVEFVCNDAPFLKGCIGEIKDIQETLFSYPYIVLGEVDGSVRTSLAAENSLRLLESSADTNKSLSCPFNPGDKVRAKSKEWLDKQPKTANGYPRVGGLTIYDTMKRICGQECTVISAAPEGNLEIVGWPFSFPAEMFEPCGLTLQTADLLISRLNPFVQDLRCQTPPMTDLPLIQNNKLLTDIQLD